MQEYILPIILLIISSFIFLQNKRTIEQRPVVFDNPWAPLIYIPVGIIGLYLLFQMGIWSLILGWLFSVFFSLVLSSSFHKGRKYPKVLEGHFNEISKGLFPGGNKEISQKAMEVKKMSNGKLNSNEAFKLVCSVSYLLATAEDKSDGRMLGYINKKTENKLNEAEAKAILEFIRKHSPTI